ncbi:probable CCR4-associated factor 1 homolog 11 [Vicia villosa]|uniref:probable CCR4-associated factor 1 homolog 11 n=1 Tax=Vicia villosa TaxID=3911 RepID=UPI00273B2133|nr:probable CCR4-associated factor 1 homolog 11 [Vicia villosa]
MHCLTYRVEGLHEYVYHAGIVPPRDGDDGRRGGRARTRGRARGRGNEYSLTSVSTKLQNHFAINKLNMNNSKEIIIRQVWGYNLEYEFGLIRHAIHRHHFISMDTEFPGAIHSPKIDHRHLRPSDHYRFLKANVDDLKLIQVGLTLSDPEGTLPDFGTNHCYIWEFNFKDFDVNRDPCNEDSIDMLRRQGINFERNLYHGVDSRRFADLMFSSILVFNKSIIWVTFSSAYDFGYLVKILTRMNLPNKLEDFLNVVEVLFGKSVYDMKYMMKFCNSLYGGLERVANTLDVRRAVGKSHQAASDSLLTLHAFTKMTKTYFKNNEGPKHAGVLFGLEMAAY